jgi:hypothetical protein
MSGMLLGIGYKDPDDKDLNLLNSEEHVCPVCQINLRFENDEFIRVRREVANVKVSDL